jgi:integrase
MASASRWNRVRVERGIHLLPNGKYAVCARRGGRLWSRTVGSDLALARSGREALIASIEAGLEPVSPRLRFATVAGWWLARFEAKVAAGERRERTLESHRYYLEHHLLPTLAGRRMCALTVDDVATLLDELRAKGCSAKTSAGALATLHSIVRHARRHGWIAVDPVERLERDERPRPARRRQRVLGREEIGRLLRACSPRDRLMIATALYTGLRISELLGLTWEDIDLDRGVIHVRAQLSRAHRDAPPRRVPTKTQASVRDIPLVSQLADLIADHRRRTPFAAGPDWVFVTANGTPHGHRNVTRRGLQRAARIAGIDDGSGPALRYHDLRHTFASHLILDLGLDVAQTSRILGHASATITLNVYTHLFDDARHAREIRAQMAVSPFARLLEPNSKAVSTSTVLQMRNRRRRP